MNILRIVHAIDRFQQRHPAVGLPFAVVKKYGDDSGGYQAALITYYGFLSLFPLLLVLLTVVQMLFQNDAQLRADVASSVSHYFPLLGNQLQSNIHTMERSGLGLAVGLLFTLYGTRGIADALRFALDNMWLVPKSDRTGFPKNILQSGAIMGCGALGFIATVGVSTFSSDLGRALWVKVMANVMGCLVVSGVLWVIFRIATSGRIPYRHMVVGAVTSAVIIQLLLTFGGMVVAHQLKTMDSVYGTFAIVLGLIFWIYLLVQVVVYAAEADTVRHLKLWPRSITPELRTEADHRAFQLYAKVGRFVKEEKIRITSSDKASKKQ